MALGQAAGLAASIALRNQVSVRDIKIARLQQALISEGAVLIYFEDAGPGTEDYEPLQFFALRGFFAASEWQANLKNQVDEMTARNWIAWSGVGTVEIYQPGKTTKGELLAELHRRVLNQPQQSRSAVLGKACKIVQ